MKNNTLNFVCIANGQYISTHSFKEKTIFKENYTLCYITNGTGTVTVDNIGFKVKAGQSFLIFPFSTVTIKSDSSSTFAYRWIEFNGYEAAWIINETVFSKKHPVVGEFPIENFESKFMVYEGEINSNVAQYRAGGRLVALLSYYVEYYPCTTQKSANYTVMACNYIEQSYRNPNFSVKSVADHLKIDRTYLYRLFKEETGMSVIDYINNCRISKAEVLLADESVSIKDVAYSVGFSDQLYFSRVFKKLRGKSPSEFRKYYILLGE